MRSWRKRAVTLVAFILACSGIFFVITYAAYRDEMKNAVITNNRTLAERAIERIDSRLDSMSEHLFDLAVTLYNRTEITSGSQSMDYQDRQHIMDAISAKTVVSSDMTALYVLDTESELFLLNFNAAVTNPVRISLKNNIRNNAEQNTTVFMDRTWSGIELINNAFLIKNIRLGRYIIGAISDCTLFFNEVRDYDSLHSLSCFLYGDNTLYFVGGKRELLDELRKEEIKDGFAGPYGLIRVSSRRLDDDLLLVADSSSYRQNSDVLRIMGVIYSLMMLILVLALFHLMNRKVRDPLQELLTANQEIGKGNLSMRLDPKTAGSKEFEELYRSFNDMSSRIGELTIESYDMKLKEEKNRLVMLRAQVRPHTFLNGITTISNMTYTHKPEEVRRYISAFAKFTRYMLHTESEWTTLRDELAHIENYISMQKIRFPDSIEMEEEISDDILDFRIPFLLLFSLVENSFKHAMTLYQPLTISLGGHRIDKEDFHGIVLSEEDDGTGFPEEVIERFEESRSDEIYTREHLGLSNVRYTLRLIYGRDDLLRLENNEQGGARTEIWLPDEEKSDEASDM